MARGVGDAGAPTPHLPTYPPSSRPPSCCAPAPAPLLERRTRSTSLQWSLPACALLPSASVLEPPPMRAPRRRLCPVFACLCFVRDHPTRSSRRGHAPPDLKANNYNEQTDQTWTKTPIRSAGAIPRAASPMMIVLIGRSFSAACRWSARARTCCACAASLGWWRACASAPSPWRPRPSPRAPVICSSGCAGCWLLAAAG